MKKLMIAAAVALAGIALNAASVQWYIDAKSFKMSDGSTLPQHQLVYLLDASADGFATLKGELEAGANYDTYGGLAGLMAQAIFSDLVVDSDYTYQASTVGSTLHNKNYAKLDKDASEDNTAPAEAGAKNNYAIFVAEGDNYLLSSPAEGIAYTSSPDDGKAAHFAMADFGAWDTYESATPGPGPEPGGVPEPTSGLLMLVGLAGLALRRRRA